MTYLLAAAASSSNRDQLGTALFAAGVFGLLGLASAVLFLVQVSLTLLSSKSADAKIFRALAIAWWVVSGLGLCDGLILLSSDANELGLLVVAAGVLCTAGMGWLAVWTGRRLAQKSDETESLSPTSVRLPILIVLGALVICGLGWWLTYQNRRHDIEAAERQARVQAAAAARARAERLEAERHARKDWRECELLASSLDQLASVDLDHAPFPDSVRIPEFGAAATDALVQRLAHGKLNAKDVGPFNPEFPCLDDQRKSILRAYARGLLRLENWTLETSVASLADEALTKDRLSAIAAQPLVQHLDGLALVAAQNKKMDQMFYATQLCKLAEAIQHAAGNPPAVLVQGGCSKLASVSSN